MLVLLIYSSFCCDILFESDIQIILIISLVPFIEALVLLVQSYYKYIQCVIGKGEQKSDVFK